jgi:hypothetical protein
VTKHFKLEDDHLEKMWVLADYRHAMGIDPVLFLGARICIICIIDGFCRIFSQSESRIPNIFGLINDAFSRFIFTHVAVNNSNKRITYTD